MLEGGGGILAVCVIWMLEVWVFGGRFSPVLLLAEGQKHGFAHLCDAMKF